MKKDDRIYLVQMLEIAERIARRMSTLSRAEFDSDEDVQLALTHLLQTIGEAARLVGEDTRSKAGGIPWRQITGMRHRVVHDYLHINLQIVWDACERDVPALIVELKRGLAALGDPRSESDQEAQGT